MNDYDQDERIDGQTGEVLPPLARDVSPAIAAEINQQVATAHRFPRRRDKEISDEIAGRATLDEDIASECQYTLKRGDKPINGPSIRFAEIVRASFGNIRVAARFVRIDDDDPKRAAVIVEAVALDLQSNNAEIIPVRRSIMTSGKGDRAPRMYNADMINTTINAASSIARRNAILAVVPKSVWIGAYQRVIRVLQGDAATLGKRRAEVVDRFKALGVEPAELYAALGIKGLEDITGDLMPTIIGLGTAIKDGESIDSVLGRAVEERGGRSFTPATDPLKDTPARPSDDAEFGTSENRGVAAGKPGADKPAAEAGPDTAAEGKTAPTAVSSPSSPANGNTSDPTAVWAPSTVPYDDWCRSWLKGASSSAAITEWWKHQRKVRLDLKLSRAETAALEAARDARFAELRE